MRTKTLLLSAVLLAAGLATASAQVFSVNAVGYVNVIVPKGFSMIANPLDAPTNTVTALLANAPDGTIIYKFDSATGFTSNLKDFGEWTRPNEDLTPGDGAFIFNSGNPFTVTFVGEVRQGNLSNPLPVGFSIQSSEVPQSAPLKATTPNTPDLNFPAVDGDIVYRFSNTAGYSSHIFDLGEWSPSAPVPAVGESFWVRKGAAVNWTRTFSVNTQP